jgi:hypothetical protein
MMQGQAVGQMMKRNVFRRKWQWSNRGTTTALPGAIEKKQEI